MENNKTGQEFCDKTNNIISLVHDEVLCINQKYIDEVDDYDFWNEHIKYVLHYAIQLAQKYNADLEIVQLGALLHDIALMSNDGAKQGHNERGALIAVELLRRFDYDRNKTEQVRKCVYNHRSSRNAESIEEICVADADILAHFANIPMIFQVGFILQKKSLKEMRTWLLEGFQCDFNDLSKRTQQDFKKEYDNIVNVILKNI